MVAAGVELEFEDTVLLFTREGVPTFLRCTASDVCDIVFDDTERVMRRLTAGGGARFLPFAAVVFFVDFSTADDRASFVVRRGRRLTAVCAYFCGEDAAAMADSPFDGGTS